ncbi:hypothetical protein ElyMa_002121000 [Elysia marginata]|uniref:Uncharacterized protein n=1 Tax=Elysia marginata TaxID=1093978 RepID=A0AAV4FHE9_9GAST|nr:hypothetical protein ElyMa_002121000 [Elysia marginata]
MILLAQDRNKWRTFTRRITEFAEATDSDKPESGQVSLDTSLALKTRDPLCTVTRFCHHIVVRFHMKRCRDALQSSNISVKSVTNTSFTNIRRVKSRSKKDATAQGKDLQETPQRDHIHKTAPQMNQHPLTIIDQDIQEPSISKTQKFLHYIFGGLNYLTLKPSTLKLEKTSSVPEKKNPKAKTTELSGDLREALVSILNRLLTD